MATDLSSKLRCRCGAMPILGFGGSRLESMASAQFCEIGAHSSLRAHCVLHGCYGFRDMQHSHRGFVNFAAGAAFHSFARVARRKRTLCGDRACRNGFAVATREHSAEIVRVEALSLRWSADASRSRQALCGDRAHLSSRHGAARFCFFAWGTVFGSCRVVYAPAPCGFRPAWSAATPAGKLHFYMSGCKIDSFKRQSSTQRALSQPCLQNRNF